MVLMIDGLIDSLKQGMFEEDGWFPSQGRDREANRCLQEIQHI